MRKGKRRIWKDKGKEGGEEKKIKHLANIPGYTHT
jgi:hypothetical protein